MENPQMNDTLSFQFLQINFTYYEFPPTHA